MIGFNGGLIGKTRTTTLGPSVPGVWTAREQAEARRNGAWPLGDVDPDYASVSVLLHGDGANNSTTFTDNSPNNFTLTGAGNAKISTAQSKFGGASMLFDGNGDYITGTLADANAFNLPNDFTVEAWIYLAAPSANLETIAGKWDTNGNFAFLFYVTSTSINFGSGSNGQFGATTTGSTSLSSNTWYHVAASRFGSSLRLFQDGALLTTATETRDCSSANTVSRLHVGINQDGLSLPFNGHIDELRITKGVARYTAAFTAPTAPFPNQ
jgi:hypothetical protein